MIATDTRSTLGTALRDTATALVASGQGILAIDESVPTISKRFAALGIEPTDESRRAYRDTLLMCPGIADFISGAILHDETMRQVNSDGVAFPQAMRDAGMICGIKVDIGTKPLAACPDETVTEGLDGLRERVAKYAELGARFAKWRAVIQVGAAGPSHTALDGIVLKPNMVVAGKDLPSSRQPTRLPRRPSAACRPASPPPSSGSHSSVEARVPRWRLRISTQSAPMDRNPGD